MKKQEVIVSLKRLAWVALFIAVMVLVVSMIEKKQIAKTSNIIINIEHLASGKDLISKGDVLGLLDRSFGYSLEGIAQNEINIERIERVIKENPFVLDADAFIDANNRIQIAITQRIPVIRIIDKMGLSYYLDKDANKLPLSKHFTARVLTATGNIPPHIPNFLEREQHALTQLFDLGERILSDDFFAPLIEQIYINNKREYTLVPKLGNQKILLGKYEDIATKLENLKAFYHKGVTNVGWRKYKTFDLRYKGQVVAEKR